MEDYFYLTKIINEHNKDRVFKSGNYGYSSTDRKNINRVKKVLEGLYELNSWNLKEGSKFFDNLKYAIIDFMKENGFDYYIDSNDKIQFKKIEVKK